MRKILTIFLLFICSTLFGQDIKPISPLFKNLQSPSFSFMIGGNPWIYKGSTFNPNPWTELAGWTNVKDTLTNYWSKIEITPSDTTRWGNGDAIQFVYKNGIHKDGDSIKLGGILTEDTDINVNGKTFFIYENDHGISVQPNRTNLYLENDSTQISAELDESNLTLTNDFYNGTLGNVGTRFDMIKDSIGILSYHNLGDDVTSSEISIKPDKIKSYQYLHRGRHTTPIEIKRGTIQDTTGIKYHNIPELYFQDSTLVPKYYVDNLIITSDTLKEDKANKENTTVDSSTTKYPTVNLLKTYADTKDPSSTNELNQSISFNSSTKDLTITDAGGSKTANINIQSGNVVNCYINTFTVTTTENSVTWPQPFTNPNYKLIIDAYYLTNYGGKTVRMSNAVYDYNKTLNGFSLKVDTIAGYIEYMAVDTTNLYPLQFSNYIPTSAITTTLGNPGSDTNIPSEKAMRTALNGTVSQDDSRLSDVRTAAPNLESNLNLNNYNLNFTTSLPINQSYSGIVESGTVGENVVFGEVLYLKFSDGKWWKAKADAYATTPATRMALATISANTSGMLLIEGNVRHDSWSFAKNKVYLSAATSGSITTTQPSTTGNQIQVIGVAKTSTVMYFKPSQDVGEK